MSTPFFVLALPRCRTAWLAQYLASWPVRVAHDLAVKHSNVVDYLRDLTHGYDGTIETAAVLGWEALRHNFPKSPVAVIRRPVGEVHASLAKFGLDADMGELERRDAMLAEVSTERGVLSLWFRDLVDKDARASVFEHLLRRRPDDGWDDYFAGRDIQIDMPARIAGLSARRDEHAAFKADVGRYIGGVSRQPNDCAFAMESWDELWPDAEALAADHFAEVDKNIEPLRPLNVNAGLMRRMWQTGVLNIATARRNGRLVGYCTWNVAPDPESAGIIIGKQGAWFVERGLGGTGLQLYLFSLRCLAQMGVHCVYPHHRTQGRGAGLSKFFLSIGAKKIQDEYSLWIGDDSWRALPVPS